MAQRRQKALRFPCTFPIKAIGKETDQFAAEVIEIVRHHVPDLNDDAMTLRHSGGGKYLAVTVVISAQNQAQLDALYRELGEHPQVLMLL